MKTRLVIIQSILLHCHCAKRKTSRIKQHFR